MDNILYESLKTPEVQQLLQNVDDLGYYDPEQIYLFRNSILSQYVQDESYLIHLHETLNKYKYIDGLDELHLGRYIRWFKKSDGPNKLTNGGFILDMSLKKDVNIVCKNYRNNLFNINFNECILFQKMSLQDELVMNIVESLKAIE